METKFAQTRDTCSKGFFKGAKFPDRLEVSKVENSNGTPQNLEVKPTKYMETHLSDVGQSAGCTVSNYWKENGRFLFRSETAIKNNEAGIVLWKVISTDEKVEEAKGDVHIFQFMLFLYSSNTETDVSRQLWKIQGGYGWQDLVPKGSIKDIKIAAPDKTEKSLIDLAKQAKDQNSKEKFYEGVWQEELSGKSVSLGISQSKLEAPWKIEASTAKGYSGVNIFYRKEGSSYVWKQFRKKDVSDGEYVTLNAKQ